MPFADATLSPEVSVEEVAPICAFDAPASDTTLRGRAGFACIHPPCEIDRGVLVEQQRSGMSVKLSGFFALQVAKTAVAEAS